MRTMPLSAVAVFLVATAWPERGAAGPGIRTGLPRDVSAVLEWLAVGGPMRASEAATEAGRFVGGRARPSPLPGGSPPVLDVDVLEGVRSAYASLAAMPIASTPRPRSWRPWPSPRPRRFTRGSGAAREEAAAAILAVGTQAHVSPDYLWATARAESGIDPSAQASTSSATGLFQFVRDTWLTSVKRFGPTSGLGLAASRISIDRRGRPVVGEQADEDQILALREDPTSATAMAAALTADDAARLKPVLGRSATAAELYEAHVLGWKSAAMLVLGVARFPKTPAFAVFPKAARSNRALFYAGGRARTLAELASGLSGRVQ